MNQLPENIADCIGKTIKLKPDAAKHSITNFGLGEYVLTITTNPLLSDIPAEERVSLFTKEEYNGNRKLVHSLARIMGYKRIREIFELANNG